MSDINTPKIVAFHLPQFHTFPENDKWWGQGFTEWVNVKKAKPYNKNHYQPQVPLNNNYYDLTNIKALIWQMELAKTYGIDAFCYYHYWFDGKLLLNKPIELIRSYEGRKLDYFLCWANEPWTRAWDGNSKQILMAQRYGGKKEWREHYEYLLNFFNDEHYLKINNCPVLVIYRTNNIPCCNEMIEYWNELCRKDGFSGIWLIEELNGFQNEPMCRASKGYLEFEPMFTDRFGRSLYDKVVDHIRTQIFNTRYKQDARKIFSYGAFAKKIYNRRRNPFSNKERYIGCFPRWDNSPRRLNKATIYINSTPKNFYFFIKKQYHNACLFNNRFIFINAWNEWGEGAYLEPDEKYKYKYLEAVKNAKRSN